MNDRIIELIKKLTEQDKKNLSQKALKVCEEAGELAKVILPFDNAHATTHRFTDKAQITEEVIDTCLAALSVAYNIGATDDEIIDMFDHKMRKWANLQAREAKIGDKLPYEIHVTVSGLSKETFEIVCKNIGVKPILLDLHHTHDDEILKDVMTSSVHLGNNRSAYEEMERIANHFENVLGATVLRKKIETVPWHPAAPSIEFENYEMPKNCYFESHIGVLCKEEDYEILKGIAVKHNAHLSRNIFKKVGDQIVIMITLRWYDGSRESFESARDAIIYELSLREYETDKVITEFSVYDTKISHDFAWINS